VGAKRSDKAQARRTEQTATRPRKEPLIEQISSFTGFFIWLLVFKSFFVPLFIIPTGSMAETLYGSHGIHTCPNCGREYPVNLDRAPDRPPDDPIVVQCPNCRWRERNRIPAAREARLPVATDGTVDERIRPITGDRIVVHGWTYELARWMPALRPWLEPQRWDIVVFKNPNNPDQNYIKRLIGRPGEKIEIIDGDIFANGEIARKSDDARRSLFFPYYDHDYPPAAPSESSGYYPRWVATGEAKGWSGLETRELHFAGAAGVAGEIEFVTELGDTQPRARVEDIYGYNAYFENRARPAPQAVPDVRLSCEATFPDGAGYLELSLRKYDDEFLARWNADGGVTLEHRSVDGGEREPWGSARLSAFHRPVRLSLSDADYHVCVEVDGNVVLESAPSQYSVTPEQARARSRLPDERREPRIRIAAGEGRLELRHVLIERDVRYLSRFRLEGDARGNIVPPGKGVDGRPILLGPQDYYVLGDNSPASADSRYWTRDDLGAHLIAAEAAGTYEIGTVPADQLLGRAFLVYWPGFLKLPPLGINILPDLGRVRWVH